MEIEYGSENTENSINKSSKGQDIEWTYATYLGGGGVEETTFK